MPPTYHPAITPTLVLAVHVHVHLRLHRRFRGSRVGYFAIAGAAVVSWAGIAGPGEALLVTGGILAARHHLGLSGVAAAGWAGAVIGGIVGWIAGLKLGRPIFTAAGPLHDFRLRAVEHGDRFFTRFGPLAVLFAPSWAAGINGMPARRFLPANLAAALVWAGGIPVAAFFIGPSVTDVIEDAGLVASVLIGLALVVAVVATRRRRRRRRRPPATRPGGDAGGSGGGGGSGAAGVS